MTDIVISYRRDTRSAAGRLYDRINGHFGKDRVFMDLDSIASGEDWKEKIRASIESSKVLLAIIGPTWLTIEDEHGKRRLEDEEDVHRFEIATGLSVLRYVVPVLVEDADLPLSDDLPGDIVELIDKPPHKLSD